MASLMEFLNERRGDRSYEEFANAELGIYGSTLWRYDKGKADIGVKNLQKMSQAAVKNDDVVLLGAIIAYATGLDIELQALERLGSCLLQVQRVPS